MLHIGRRIEEVLKEQRRSAIWLASEIYCTRTNIYKIFDKPDIDTGLLRRISNALDYDFFKDLSESMK